MARIWWWNYLLLLSELRISDACRSGAYSSCKHDKSIFTLDCTNIDLPHLKEENLPPENVVLERLYLRNTCLKTLQKNVFSGIKDLWYLDMSNNHLSSLNKNIFKDLPNLLHLDLSNNKLNSLTDSNIFRSQGNLITLLLDNNNILNIYSSVLEPLSSIKLLKLTGNLLNCDCDLRLTMLWCAERELVTNAICGYPGNLIGEPWSELNFSHCYHKLKTTTLRPTTEKFTTTVGWNLTSLRSELNLSSPTSEWTSSSPATESNPTFETSSETLSSSDTHVAVISASVVGFLLLLFIGCAAVVCYWKKYKPSNIRDSNTLVEFEPTPNTDYYYYEHVTGPVKGGNVPTYAPKLPERPSNDINSQCKTNQEEVYDYAETVPVQLDDVSVDENKYDKYQKSCLKATPMDNNSDSKGHLQQCTSEVIIENNYYSTEE